MPEADLSDWDHVVEALLNPEYTVRVAMVGKYVELPDAYKSVNEALLHAGIQNRVKVQIEYINAEELEGQNPAEVLKGIDAILVPGGLVSAVLKVKCRRFNMPVKTKYLSWVFV